MKKITHFYKGFKYKNINKTSYMLHYWLANQNLNEKYRTVPSLKVFYNGKSIALRKSDQERVKDNNELWQL